MDLGGGSSRKGPRRAQAKKRGKSGSMTKEIGAVMQEYLMGKNAIDMDGSQTKLDQMIHSVDSSSPRKGGNDEEADVLAAVKESEMHVDQEDYAHLNTPKSYTQKANKKAGTKNLSLKGTADSVLQLP